MPARQQLLSQFHRIAKYMIILSLAQCATATLRKRQLGPIKQIWIGAEWGERMLFALFVGHGCFSSVSLDINTALKHGASKKLPKAAAKAILWCFSEPKYSSLQVPAFVLWDRVGDPRLFAEDG